MAVFSKLKQIKNMRSEAKKVQKTMAQETVHGEGAGGKVGVVMDGNQDILSVDIAEELLTPTRKSDVEKGVKDAMAGAQKELQRVMAAKVRSGDLKLPNFGG